MEDKKLNFRQRQVLLLSGFRFPEEQIAKKLLISPSTVNKDLRLVYQKLKVNRLAVAVLVCLAIDEITVEDVRCLYYTLRHINN